jgi:hypothetical protein
MTDINTQTTLINNVHNKQYEDGTSITDHLNELECRKTLANQSGAVISDELYKSIIIKSLPYSWNSVALPLYGLASSLKVIQRLRTYQQHLETKQPVQPKNSQVTPYLA